MRLKAINETQDFNVRRATMDLIACHLNGSPLDFKKMVTMRDTELMQEFIGIEMNIDRYTGKLINDHVPFCQAMNIDPHPPQAYDGPDLDQLK